MAEAPDPTLAAIVAAAAPWIKRNTRTCWEPQTTQDEGRSHFGGSPDGAGAWPRCGACEVPMALHLELHVEDLPEPPTSSWPAPLLQVFSCSVNDGMCDTWEPFSGTQAVRFVTPSGISATAPDGAESFPVRAIVSWQAHTETPSPPDLDRDGISLTYDHGARTQTVTVDGTSFPPVSYDVHVHEALSTCRDGDKLGGWPFWIQGPERPSCTACGETMTVLLQIDSERNLPVMWGDAGIAHVSLCPAHPSVATLHWACG